jgi:hypothetical protein
VQGCIFRCSCIKLASANIGWWGAYKTSLLFTVLMLTALLDGPSVLTIGQAIGPAIGGVLYAGDLVYGAGYALMGLSRWRFWR